MLVIPSLAQLVMTYLKRTNYFDNLSYKAPSKGAFLSKKTIIYSAKEVIRMNKTKVLLIISSVILLSLGGCGKKKGSSNPDASSIPGGEDKITPVDVEKLKNNINGIKNVTLHMSITDSEIKEESLGEGLPKIETFESAEISYISKADSNGNEENLSSYKQVAGYTNLTKLAADLGISKDALLDRMSSQIKRYDAENDRAIMEEKVSSGHSFEWYSKEDQQRIQYSADEDECSYSLDDDSGVGAISEMKKTILDIVDGGKLDTKTSTFTFEAKEIGDIFGDIDVDTATLFIQDNYPKRISAEKDGNKLAITLYDYNKTTVQVPSGVKPAACNHVEYSSYYDKEGDSHRLYCGHCRKYLAPKENHTLLNSDSHKYCTKCQEIVNTESANSEYGYVKIGDENVYIGGFKICKTNNKLYSTIYSSFGYRKNSKSLISKADLCIVYWPDDNVLLVRKAYAPNDDSFTTINVPETIGYSCYSAIKNTYEVFTGVKSSDYPSLADGTFKQEDYATIKAAIKSEKQVEAYYLSINHTTSTTDEDVDSCTVSHVSRCSVCNEITSSYVTTNHDIDYTKAIKKPVDDCHYELLYECKKCHNKGDANNYKKITDHKNATYRYLTSEQSAYLKLKYDVNANNSYRYVEVSCPTCKEEALYEFSGSLYNDHLKYLPSRANYVYTIKGDEITRTYDKYINIPHTPDKYGVCKYCGEGSIVVTVTEGVRILVSYSFASGKDTLNNIIVSDQGFAYDHSNIETIEGNKRKTTYYADQAGTQVICSYITTNMYGEYLEIFDNAGKSVYKAEKGQPLPSIH